MQIGNGYDKMSGSDGVHNDNLQTQLLEKIFLLANSKNIAASSQFSIKMESRKTKEAEQQQNTSNNS